jgi:DNA invertase Pin-like site-specific DNA recombinase
MIWKVSRLVRNMLQVVNTVYELADHGVTGYPVKSQAGPIGLAMGTIFWAIHAWYAAVENEEQSEAIGADHVLAKAKGATRGR